MASYYSGFDVLVIDEHGVPVPQAGVTVQVYDETASASLASVTSDDFGVVASGSYPSTAAGHTLRFTVSGYDGELRRNTTATTDFISEQDVSLILENLYLDTPQPAAYNDIYIKGSNQSEPVHVGRVEPGDTLKVPYNPAENPEIKIYAIARSERGASSAFDLARAVETTISPNTETLQPILTQIGASAADSVQIGVKNFTRRMRYRGIQVASDEDFDDLLAAYTIDFRDSINITPDVQNIARPIGLVGTDAYVRVNHSSIGGAEDKYSPWSEPLEISFTNELNEGVPELQTDNAPVVDQIDGSSLVNIWFKEALKNNYNNKLEIRIIDINLGKHVSGNYNPFVPPKLYFYDSLGSDIPSDGRFFNNTTGETIAYTSKGVDGSGDYVSGITRGVDDSTAANIDDNENLYPIVLQKFLDAKFFPFIQTLHDFKIQYRMHNAIGASVWSDASDIPATGTPAPTPTPPPATPDPDPAGYENPNVPKTRDRYIVDVL